VSEGMSFEMPLKTNGFSLVNIAAITSVGSTGWAWLEPVGTFLQIVASLVAIIVGYYAIRNFRKKSKEDE